MTFGKSYSTQIKKVNILILSMLLLWSALLPTTVQAFSAPGYTWTLFNGGEGSSAEISEYPNAYSPHTVMFNNELYAIWREQNMINHEEEIRVMRWTGNEWVAADGGSSLTYSPTFYADYPSLAVYNDQLYAIWVENLDVRVKKLENGSWVSADNEIALNGTGSTRDGRTPTLIEFDGYLYAAWIDDFNQYKLYVKKYDGQNWTTELDGYTFKPNSHPQQPSFGIYNDELYITWSENSLVDPYYYYLPVIKQTGDAEWTNVSGEYGLSNDPTNGGSPPQLVEYDGKLIAVWKDYNSSLFRIKSYDGTGWSNVGNGLIPTPSGESPQSIQLTTFRDKLFMSWVGYKSSPFQLQNRVQYYDGINYTLVSDGIKNSRSDGKNSSLAVNEQAIYMVWSDANEIFGAMYKPVPKAPIGLFAAATNNSVTLSWNTDTEVANYSIYMGTSSQSYDSTPIATVNGSTGSYTVNNLTTNQRYYFAVRASNPDGISEYSSEVQAFIIPMPPQFLIGLTLTPGNEIGTTQVSPIFEMPGSYRYSIVDGGLIQPPMSGSNANDLGFVLPLNFNSDIAVLSGQQISIVEVDQSDRILKWIIMIIMEPNIKQEPIPTVTPERTTEPTVEPTVAPTVEPTVAPTTEPTVEPTVAPTTEPTIEPTVAPTTEPTVEPTVVPTIAPTTVPTAKPTQKPTPMPTASTSNSEQNSFIIDVDGNEQAQIATAQMKTENGKAVMYITFDETKLKQLVADQSSDIVITLPSNQSSNTVIGTLNGQTIKMMEKSTLRIATEFGSYTLPLYQIHISSLSEQLGSEMQLSDVEINIQLELQSEQNVAIQHTSDHMEIIAPVVDFRIIAAYGDRKVEIAEFDNYVERMIAIPEGVDPSKITTGIVILENGEVHHIPTRVTQVDGVYYAIINSMFNSNYSVIYNEKTFDDISGHWAQKSIENLASRLVLQGVTSNQYEPNQNITRAEFAAILVRALGLYQSNEKTAYTDMEQEAWYSDVVSIATSYSLMNGFPDGRFNPEQNVTREEAMVAIARAVALIKAEADLQPSEQQTANLTQFSDTGVISQWAEPAVALNVSNGIVQGSGQSLRPLANLSRAELAVMIERLLRQVNLI